MSKTIVITGANGGLGAPTVKKFLDKGHKVIAVDQSGTNLGFAAGHENFELRSVDATSETAVATFVEEAIELYGRIDAAFLLVGGFAMGDITTTDVNELRRMFSLNFETAYFFARPLFRHMIGAGYGRIVFMGARPALRPDQGKGILAYTLSKSLLFDLAALLNATAEGKDVVSSVIAPSTLDTPTNRKEIPDADPTSWVKPSDVAALLEFICSPEADALREPIYKIYNKA
jgi:NAD(P)-dependent dehydrogenase (short-subunit alcohol dehydrogenase family)